MKVLPSCLPPLVACGSSLLSKSTENICLFVVPSKTTQGMGGQRGLRCTGCMSRIAVVLVIALSLGSAAGIQLHLGEEECGSVGGFSFRSLFLLSSPAHISYTTKPHSTHPSTC